MARAVKRGTSHRTEEQLRLFVEQAPVGIAMFDRDMIYIAASQRWIDDCGNRQANIIGRRLYELMPELPNRWKEIHRRGLAGEVQSCEDDLWSHSDGSKHWLRWTVRPWLERRRKIGGIIIFTEDITARKRDELLLQEQKQQLALITNNVPGPLALLDQDCRYVFVNQMFESWVGKRASEILGRQPWEILEKEAAERARPHLEQLFRGETVVYENFIKGPAGERRHGLITAVPQRAANGTNSSYVVIGSDITPLKEAEQALRQANETLEQRVRERTAELEAANRELEAFSYSVSHDLRAPLRVIDGYSRMVLQGHAASLPAEAQELLRDIRASTRQMSRLISDLLAFSRLSRQPLQRKLVDVDELVRTSLAALMRQQDSRRFEICIGELFPCQGDAGLLRQVFLNLLDNALKYTRQRELSRIDIGSQRAEGRIIYHVRDNGVGFDMRHARKLFEVFHRLHAAEEYEGTGVGLAIVQRIVQRHGGCVWAESEPNRGAAFFFTVPDGTTSALGETPTPSEE